MATATTSTAILGSCCNNENTKNGRKRKSSLFGFRSFPTRPSLVIGDMRGAFRDNIRLFLDEFGEVEEYSDSSGMATWSTLLVSETNGVVYPLYTVEEDVQTSPRPFCHHCKCIGWSHHFVSKRRYHFIIPADDDYWKNNPFKGDDNNCLELRTHLLHGVIHCNGFGHFLRVNGIEQGGSDSLRGTDIMDLWDRICTTLRTRKISLNDESEKKSMKLRLLHSVAFGHTWFGNWRYKFARGSFGVTEHKYVRAIQFLRSLELDKIMDDFSINSTCSSNRARKLKQIICCYRRLSLAHLITIADLLQFMLALESRTPPGKAKLDMAMGYNYCPSKPTKSRKLTWTSKKDESQVTSAVVDNRYKAIELATFVSKLVRNDCRWPAKRLQHAVEVCVDLLNESMDGVMCRQDLRDGARKYIGDTGLIDFVLKSITCVAVGNQIVRRSNNPSTRLLEFSIMDDLEGKMARTFASSLAKLEPRWPEQMLEHAVQVIINILKENNGMPMSRQELREAARPCIGDTGLIDFVLKSINNNSVVGDQILSRSKNPTTGLIEFTIQESPSLASEFMVYDAVLFLYKNVLLGYQELDPVGLATRAVLDAKHFVKEWLFQEEKENNILDNGNNQLMAISCRVLPSFDELETELTRPLPPGELVLVPQWATIGEVKVVAQQALRDTYCVMDRLVVNQIGGLKGIQEDRVISCAVESGAHVWVRGCGLDLDTKLRYEGGVQVGLVDCMCGARSDDGERMFSCDVCQVWNHARCIGVDDDKDASSFSLCSKCSASIVL